MITNNNALFGEQQDRRIYIWDETLRDGEQSPGVYFNTEQKIKIAKSLAEAGVHMIDAGFPPVSKEERYTIQK
ncbi:MAG: hypothetical protein ABIA37_02695, partial [Candidatus Woesearchaeota archaeon]